MHRPASIHVVETDENHLLSYIGNDREWQHLLSNTGLFAKAQSEGGTPPYSIVSIMGPQSSGKSTILNRVFGCEFATMDSRKGRQQTTTGIWLSNAPKGGDVLVMDLEGTDSTQRSENRINFERQTSLFALSLSEVLIINMWQNEIGRVSGMNLDTLQSILEANLRLNFPKTKTMLLFLIREQHPDDTAPGVTPKATLAQLITQHLEGVWLSIDKPDDYKNTPLADLFDVKFYFVAPLVYFPKEFEENCVDLYNRFTNPSYPDYYFNTEYHFRKAVPLEDLNRWTHQIWESISKDETLNIPDQQRLLSAYRCEAAMNGAYQKLAELLRDTVAAVERDGYTSSCGKSVDAAVVEARELYESATKKYIPEEALKKLASLMDKIRSYVLSRIFTAQMRTLTGHVVESFEKNLQSRLPRNACTDNFEQEVMNCTERARDLFRERFAESCPQTLLVPVEVPVEHKSDESTEPEEDRVDVNDFIRMFDRNLAWDEIGRRLRDVTKTMQSDQYNKLLDKELQQLTEDHLVGPLARLFSNPPVHASGPREETKYETNPTLNPTASNLTANVRPGAPASATQVNEFWKDVSTLRIEFHGNVLQRRIIPKLENLMFDKETTRTKALEVRDSTDELIQKKVERFANNIEQTAKNTFAKYFENDPQTKIPRNWTPNSDIDTYFSQARDAVDKLFDIVSYMTVEGNEQLGLEQMVKRVITEENLQELKQTLDRHMNRAYQIARNQMNNVGGGNSLIPRNPITWMIFLFFAWNEIWSILTNPIYLFGAIFVIIIGFVAFQAQTLGDQLGVDVRSIAQATIKKLLTAALAQIKSILENVGSDNNNNSQFGNGVEMGSAPSRAGRRASVPVNSMSNQPPLRGRRAQSEMVSQQDLDGLNVPPQYQTFGAGNSNGPSY